MKYIMTFAVMMMVMGPVTAALQTEVISINFVGGSSETDGTVVNALGTADRAGVIVAENWNNAGTAKNTAVASSGNQRGSLSTLVNNSGISTTASLMWNSSGTWSSPVAENDANDSLMRGYLDPVDEEGAQVTISNLGIEKYNLYVYVEGGNTRGRTGRYQVFDGAGVNGTLLGTIYRKDDAAFWEGTFQQAAPAATVNEATVGGDYIVFSGLRSSTVTLFSQGESGTRRAPIAGIQIVAASKPAAKSLIISDTPVTISTAASVFELQEMNYVFIREDAEVLSQPILSEPVTATSVANENAGTVVVKLDAVVQSNLAGIGGAFNEQGGEAFMSLPAAERKKVAKALFNPEKGAGLTLCRTAVGSSDFGLGAYSYSETADDFEMKHFSVKRDTKSVLPFIRAAQAENPELRIFASPWSPPGWMKESGKMDKGGKDSVLKKDPAIYKAYALYFSKYVQAYAKNGVPIDRIIIQNETDMNPTYPGCDMLPDQMAELVSGYIRPQFKKDGLKSGIWAGTFRGINRPEYRKDALVFMTLDGHKDVDGLGMQYCAPNILKELRDTYPKLKLMHTEGICRDGRNTVEHARLRFGEIAGWLYNGTENYCYWNMVLNEGGKSGWGWKQNSLMLIDRQTKEVTYTKDFAPLALLSRYIRPGDELLQAHFQGGKSLAVRNKERLVVFVQNDEFAPVSRNIDLSGKKVAVELPAQSLCAFVFKTGAVSAAAIPKKASVYGTITEETPSIPQYFSWINNTNEGSTEQQTLTNLTFFKWLYDTYGMNLGIYAWDAGNIDSARYYGSMQSDKFKAQYPNGWRGIADLAKSFGCRLGLWGGPDGFGKTPEEEKDRTELLVSLCRDYGLQLFKFDSVCTQLRDEKQPAFAKAMTECREYAPDLVVLNHRLNLGDAKPHATTFLWGGAETYIDVHMRNSTTAPHNRAGALSRGLPPGLQRLTEDHGVCISSCLDAWDDDLILQGFNRSLILAPQIYGNPWLLRDDEFAKLSRIFNLHFRNRDILVKGMVLPEAKYGQHAVARGDGSTRFITLRNLSWKPVTYNVALNEEIGLTDKGSVEVRRYHPSERILGTFEHGESVQVEVAPFRSCLLAASTKPCDEIGIVGCDYEVVRDLENKPVWIKLLGMPGSSATVSVQSEGQSFSKAFIANKAADGILEGDMTIRFPGKPVAQPWHKHLAELKKVNVPADAESLYEATCFAAENNALEVQSLHRSGPTDIPEVQKARDAFFDQELFWRRGVWDKYMFDENLETFFSVYHYGRDKRLDKGALRVDFGKPESMDRISLRALWSVQEKNQPPQELTAEVSQDLKIWKTVTFRRKVKPDDKSQIANIGANGGNSKRVDADVYTWNLNLGKASRFRYVRIFNAPGRVAEFDAFKGRKKLDAANWRATNLFAPFSAANPVAAWQAAVKVESNTAEGSYLCVALEGKHGANKAFAALRVDGKWIGASQRAPSFPCVAWEYPVRNQPANDTYFFPVTDDMRGKQVDVVVLGLTGGETECKPQAWITTHQTPAETILLRLEE